MRIILTTNYSPWSAYSGGGQQSTHQTAAALSKLGHDVTVVYTRPPWERINIPSDLPYRVQWAFYFGLRSRVNSPLRPLNAISVGMAVKRLCGCSPVDVVHAQGEEGALIPLFNPARRFAFIVSPRYPDFPAALAGGGSLIEKIKLYTVRFKYIALGAALRRADRVTPTSAHSAQNIMHYYGIPTARITVVNNGINPVFTTVKRLRGAAMGPVVFFGRIARAKGVEVLLRALHTLGRTAPRAVLIGRGDDADRIRSLADKLGLGTMVEFRDWMHPADLAGLLAGASMAVLPSLEESFGNAMIEALSCGTPLITSTAGSIPEVLPEDGVIFTAPGKHRPVADAIRTILKHPQQYRTAAKKGSTWCRHRYSWDGVARQLVSIYTVCQNERDHRRR